MNSRTILITGCSSGIGRATALQLLRSGHRVAATARNPETLAELAAAGAMTLAMDVTDESSMLAAVAAIDARFGHIEVLVNNAGYGEYGPVEEVSIERVRRQFETNVFGLARLTQLVLPGMRNARFGRIIHVGSMGGRMTLPLGGYYHATKYALEALTDALRTEVRGFGIDVSLIEPGSIRTGFNQTIGDTLTREHATADGPYAALKQGFERALASPLAARIAGSPDAVARAIEHAASARRPRTRYVITVTARALIALRRWLPDRGWDWLALRLVSG